MAASRSEVSAIPAGVEHALAVLAARPSALITDVDGTISPIAPRPEDAVVSPVARAALERLVGALNLVAVVTARAESVARDMVGVEDLTYVGNYGLYGADVGDGASLDALRTMGRQLVGRFEGAEFEEKGIAFALHYRNTTEPARIRDEFVAALEPEAIAHGARLVEGKQVVEIVPAALPGKDASLRRLAAEHGLDGIVYLGDDVSDVVAFGEILRRREAGHPGLAIAVKDDETPAFVSRAADLTLFGVGEAAAFLALLADTLAAKGAGR
jgi:trehalose 6-phosphate phosphatase